MKSRPLRIDPRSTILHAVRTGAADEGEVAAVTGLPVSRVLLAALQLRGMRETPDLLCCFDGDPWALTMDGMVCVHWTLDLASLEPPS